MAALLTEADPQDVVAAKAAADGRKGAGPAREADPGAAGEAAQPAVRAECAAAAARLAQRPPEETNTR